MKKEFSQNVSLKNIKREKLGLDFWRASSCSFNKEIKAYRSSRVAEKSHTNKE